MYASGTCYIDNNMPIRMQAVLGIGACKVCNAGTNGRAYKKYYCRECKNHIELQFVICGAKCAEKYANSFPTTTSVWYCHKCNGAGTEEGECDHKISGTHKYCVHTVDDMDHKWHYSRQD